MSEEEKRKPLDEAERLRLGQYIANRYTVDEMHDFTSLLIRDGNNSAKELITYWVNQWVNTDNELAALKAKHEYAVSALIEAKKIIRQWHGMGMPDEIEPRIWGIYESQAPEMKRLNEAIKNAESITGIKK